MTREIFAAEINFEDAPLHIREKFSGAERNIRRICAALAPFTEEVYALATAQRFTVFVVHENISPLTRYFHVEHDLTGYVQYYYNTEESVAHLFATASGLLSPIKGDRLILSQIREACRWATECGCLGVNLHQVVNQALEVGSMVRTATGIDKFCASIVETGLHLLYNKIENLHKKTFLIVGTGKVARLALQYLSDEGVRDIIVAGNHDERALQLSQEFRVKMIPRKKIATCFHRAAIIIGASHQEVDVHFPATGEHRSMEKLPGKNRFMLDFGIPRNFDPRLAELFNADLYNIDDLRRLQPSFLESFGGLELAWSMVMKASGQLAKALQQLQQSPVLMAYLQCIFRFENALLNHGSKRTILNFFRVKKPADPNFIPVPDHRMNKLLLNNYKPENPSEIVRHIQALKKFKFLLKDN
jgi:glutamyl-tRNA reductase